MVHTYTRTVFCKICKNGAIGRWHYCERCGNKFKGFLWLYFLFLSYPLLIIITVALYLTKIENTLIGAYFFCVLVVIGPLFIYSQYTITDIEKETVEVSVVAIGGIIYGIVVGALFSSFVSSLSGIAIGIVAGVGFGVLCTAIITPVFGGVLGIEIGAYVGINSYLCGMVFAFLSDGDTLKAVGLFIAQVSLPCLVCIYPIYDSKIKVVRWTAYQKGLMKKEEERKLDEEIYLVRKETPQGVYELAQTIADEGKLFLAKGDYTGAQIVFESALRNMEKARILAIRMGSTSVCAAIEKSIDKLKEDLTICKELRKKERANELIEMVQEILKKSKSLYEVREYSKSIKECENGLAILREADRIASEIGDDNLRGVVEKIRSDANQHIEECKIKEDYRKALELSESASEKFKECKVHIKRGELLRSREMLREVETIVEDAITICLDRKFDEMLADLKILLTEVINEKNMVLKILTERVTGGDRVQKIEKEISKINE